MNMKFTSTEDSYRGQAWCMSAELTDNGDGTYTINDERAAKMLGGGIGSEIVVIDIPGKFLFVGDDGLAYDWTSSSSGGGGDEPPAGYVTVAPKQNVTVTDDTYRVITLADGISIQDPTAWPLTDYATGDWVVKLNDEDAPLDETTHDYRLTDDNLLLRVFVSSEEGVLYVFFEAVDGNGDFVPGTYTVSIYAPESEGQ